jgi:hypothetical protein
MMCSLLKVVVTATVSMAVVQSQGVISQEQLEPITDPEAYAIYAVLLSPLWATHWRDALVLLQETEVSFNCRSSLSENAEWSAVHYHNPY